MVKLVEMSLKIATVFCVYLVLTISTASAVELSIYRQIMSGGSPTPTDEKIEITFDHSDKIDKGFEFVHDAKTDPRWERVQVKIGVIGNDPLYPISKIYLFRCKDSLPLDCVDYEPVEADSFLSGEKGTFYWSDVSRGTKANFLTLVKFTHDGKDSWVGYWDEAVRSGVQNFEHVSDSYNYELSYINLYAEPGVEPAWIKDFIEDHNMIPANWVEKSVFGPVGGNPVSEIYELVADGTEMGALSFGRYKPSGNIVTAIVKEYLIAFAKGSIADPVTFFSNDLPTCGDGECEVGEDPSNCCLDCGCPSESQQCSSNDNYPDGLCHVCGDGVKDPVENGTNCCVDAGCPDGLYCDNAMNIPYGQCVTPQCGNDICELAEDSGTCPADCWNTPGRTCEVIFGSGYYYDDLTQQCKHATCPDTNCEPSEDTGNCCADCGCPPGDYCDTDTLTVGVCTAPNCGDGECEPGEDYSNCCLDCKDCPVDPNTGQLQVCLNNVCHLCGNGIIESPVETEDTCCQDTGCTNGYCSVAGNCKTENEMGLRVSILPSSVDCTQADSNVDVKFTLVNAPVFIDSYQSVTYLFENGRYTLSDCRQQGEAYLCRMSLSGPDTFQGCFDEGMKDLDFTVVLTYFEDTNGQQSNDLKYIELQDDLSFEVTNARLRSCNKDGVCDAGAGESSDYCCWDCMCGGGDICTSSGCQDEAGISLVINPEDLPARHNIDCSPSGIGHNNEFSFMAHVQNVPEHAQERFRVLNWKLIYNGRTYTAQNIPGFACTALSTETGYHTGDVECRMPVSMFPACPDPPQPDVELFSLELNVLGGGLAASYPIYEGKEISDGFSLDYVQGLPLCGNGYPNPELGEVIEVLPTGELNVPCCQDTGCPDGMVCTINAGCVDRSLMRHLDVTIDPNTVDCSAEAAGTTRPKEVIITATAPYKPYSPETGGLEFGDAFLNNSRIGGELYGVCQPFVNSSSYSVYAWRCSVPVSEFSPFCWIRGDHDATFETTIAWFDRSGIRQTENIKEPLFFRIDPARERRCIVGGGCQATEYGEMPGTIDDNPIGCCADCGCVGIGNVCTLDNKCREKRSIEMSVDVKSPSLNCQALDSDVENDLLIEATIVNRPFHVSIIRWSMDYDENGRTETFSMPYFICEQVIDELSNKDTGVYECTMPVYNFPGCGTAGPHDIVLNAYVIYEDYNGYRYDIELDEEFTVNVGNADLPQCGNGYCDRNLGETPDNCCEDCPCLDDKICLEEEADGSRCYDGDIILKISDGYQRAETECHLTPGTTVDIMGGEDRKTVAGKIFGGRDFKTKIEDTDDRYVIKDYGCMFNEPLEVEVTVDPMPYSAYFSSGTFVWTEESGTSSVERRLSWIDGDVLGGRVVEGVDPAGGSGAGAYAASRSRSSGSSYYGDAGETYHITGFEEIPDGWRLNLMLNQDGSYTFGATAARVTKGYATIDDISITMQSATLQGKQRVITAKTARNDNVDVTINHIKDDQLLDYEQTLMDIQDAMRKSNNIVCFITSILATCVVCSLMAGGVEELKEENMKEFGEKSADLQDKFDEAIKDENIKTEKRTIFGSNEVVTSYTTEFNGKPYAGANKDEVIRQIQADYDSELTKLSKEYNILPETTQSAISTQIADVNTEFNNLVNVENVKYPVEYNGKRYANLEQLTAAHNKRIDGIKSGSATSGSGDSRTIRLQMPTGGAFGGIPMSMFSNIMNMMSGSSAKSARITGVLAAGIFAIAEMTITKCSGAYWGTMAAATAMCYFISKGGNAKTLESIVKMCDVMASLVGLLQMITKMQSTMLTYQACMVSAESALASRSMGQETGYEMSSRTYNYFNTLQQCQASLNNGMGQLMDDLSKYSYQLQQSQGWSDPSITVTPDCRSTIGPNRPDSQIIINFNLPQYSSGYGGYGRYSYDSYSRSNYNTRYGGGYSSSNYPYSWGSSSYGGSGITYGYLTIQFNYQYTNSDSQPLKDASRKATFTVRQNTNGVTCDVSKYGLKCTDGITTPKSLYASCKTSTCGETAILTGHVSITFGGQQICSYVFDTEEEVDVVETEEEVVEEDGCGNCVEKGWNFVRVNHLYYQCWDKTKATDDLEVVTTPAGCAETVRWYEEDSGGTDETPQTGDDVVPPAPTKKCSDFTGAGCAACIEAQASDGGSCVFFRSPQKCAPKATASPGGIDKVSDCIQQTDCYSIHNCQECVNSGCYYNLFGSLCGDIECAPTSSFYEPEAFLPDYIITKTMTNIDADACEQGLMNPIVPGVTEGSKIYGYTPAIWSPFETIYFTSPYCFDEIYVSVEKTTLQSTYSGMRYWGYSVPLPEYDYTSSRELLLGFQEVERVMIYDSCRYVFDPFVYDELKINEDVIIKVIAYVGEGISSGSHHCFATKELEYTLKWD